MNYSFKLFTFFTEEAFFLLAGRCTAAHQRIEPEQGFTLFGIEPGRNIDNDSYELIASDLCSDILNALALQSEHAVRLCTLGYIVFNLSVKRRHHKRIAQSRLNKVDMNLTLNVEAVTLEERMRSDIDNNMKVARRAAVDALVALSADIEDLTVVNTCRDIDLKRTLLCDTSSAAAL